MRLRQRRLTILLSLVAIFLLALGGGAYAYWFFLIRGPLAGEMSHDFGDVPLDGQVTLTHTFRFVNRFDREVAIDAVRTDCGCVLVRDVRTTLEPGEQFELPVQFTAIPGPRSALVHVIMNDGTKQTLKLQAVGRPQPRIWKHLPAAALGEDGVVEVTFIGDTFDTYDEPPPPAIATSHEQLAAEFRGWTLKYRPRKVAISPTNWEGKMRVRWTGGIDALPEDASVTLTLPTAVAPLVISIEPPGTTLAPARFQLPLGE